jgi:CheY-like chemotaxis protein
MDGLETLEHLRANLHTTHTAIIAIPGMSRSEPCCMKMISGCEAYIRKPFDLVLLRRVVTQSLAFHPARYHYR